MLAIAVIALLLFGPDKLPEMARTVGRVIRQLKKMSEDLTDELKMDFDEPAVHPDPVTDQNSSPVAEALDGSNSLAGPALNGHGQVAGELAQRDYPPGKEPV